MAPPSSIFAWKIPWTEEPGAGYSPWVAKSRTQLSNKHTRAPLENTEVLYFLTKIIFLGS